MSFPTSRVAQIHLTLAKWQIVKCVQDPQVRYVESREPFVRPQIIGIRYQSWGVGGGCLVQGIAIVQRLRVGVDPAERQPLAESSGHIHLKGVVRTRTNGKPRPRVRDARIRPWGSWRNKRDVVGASRNRSAGNARREIRGIGSGAR